MGDIIGLHAAAVTHMLIDQEGALRKSVIDIPCDVPCPTCSDALPSPQSTYLLNFFARAPKPGTPGIVASGGLAGMQEQKEVAFQRAPNGKDSVVQGWLSAMLFHHIISCASSLVDNIEVCNEAPLQLSPLLSLGCEGEELLYDAQVAKKKCCGLEYLPCGWCLSHNLHCTPVPTRQPSAEGDCADPASSEPVLPTMAAWTPPEAPQPSVGKVNTNMGPTPRTEAVPRASEGSTCAHSTQVRAILAIPETLERSLPSITPFPSTAPLSPDTAQLSNASRANIISGDVSMVNSPSVSITPSASGLGMDQNLAGDLPALSLPVLHPSAPIPPTKPGPSTHAQGTPTTQPHLIRGNVRLLRTASVLQWGRSEGWMMPASENSKMREMALHAL
ncbi:hypothetical protein JB92DRAFT_2836028 [Gautieria morchelliformis]|nr:hypothetical protein JB92DRAFT_2836028 [Gautieria morchelliformis]